MDTIKKETDDTSDKTNENINNNTSC